MVCFFYLYLNKNFNSREIILNNKKKPKPFGYWTYERLVQTAKKYDSKKTFMTAENGAYQIACRKGIIHEICAHMIAVNKPHGYWNIKANCASEAKKYNSRKEFIEFSNGAYAGALKNGWIDEICSHMKVSGNRFLRAIYVWEFSDKSAYIGLTYNYKTRYQQHIKKGTVARKLKKFNGKFIKLNIFYEPIEAQLQEQLVVEKYRLNGWKILNKVKTGALGSIDSIWDLDGCIFAAHFCDSYKDFHTYFKAAYKAAIRNGWVYEIRKFFDAESMPYGYFNNKDNCRTEALQYSRRVDFMKGSPGSYKFAMQNKFLDEICVHMQAGRKPNGYYTKKVCRTLMLECNSRMDFKSKYSTAYAVSVKNGWIDDFFPKRSKRS